MPTLLLMFTPWLKTPANHNDIVNHSSNFWCGATSFVQNMLIRGFPHEVISSGEKKYYEILISLPFWFI